MVLNLVISTLLTFKLFNTASIDNAIEPGIGLSAILLLLLLWYYWGGLMKVKWFSFVKGLALSALLLLFINLPLPYSLNIMWFGSFLILLASCYFYWKKSTKVKWSGFFLEYSLVLLFIILDYIIDRFIGEGSSFEGGINIIIILFFITGFYKIVRFFYKKIKSALL